MTTTANLADVKSRQRLAWGAGDYAVIGTTLQITGELLCEAVDLAAGERVLDVAAGNGNAALAAARRGCAVTAVDYVDALLDSAATRASGEGLFIDCKEADAEALPFADDSFDVVLSTFGVMFTPDQYRAAAELQRVCRPGGRVGLANWTPSSFVGQMFAIVGRFAPPPAGVRSPLEWGTDERLAELLDRSDDIRVERRHFVFRYPSPRYWVDTFRTFYGPLVRAFAALTNDDRAVLLSELVALAERHNTQRDGTLRVPSEYLEVVATLAR